MQQTPSPSTRILRKPAVIERVGLSDTTIWRLMREGKFPRPVRLSENAVGWRELDIDAWIESRTHLREAARPSPNPRAHKPAAKSTAKRHVGRSRSTTEVNTIA
jgi:prophage regulatory protein